MAAIAPHTFKPIMEFSDFRGKPIIQFYPVLFSLLSAALLPAILFTLACKEANFSVSYTASSIVQAANQPEGGLPAFITSEDEGMPTRK